MAKDRDIDALRAEKDVQIAALNQRVAHLNHNPYSEDVEQHVRVVLNEMTHEGHLLLRHLLMHEPAEVGRPFMPEIPIERQSEQMGIALKRGIVRHVRNKERLFQKVLYENL